MSAGWWGSRGLQVAVFVALASTPALAQTSNGNMELGAHVAVLRISEFDITDAGVGLNATFRATPILSVDGSLTWFPGNDDSTGRRVASQQRSLGLVGARWGIRRGAIELTGRVRAGFLRFSPVDQAACIAINAVPRPLECQIATGYTAFATDIGGGVLVTAGDRVRVRVDAGDLTVRYGEEARRPNGNPTEGLTSHNLQVGAGLIWRF
jgi:hypothetical protein